MTLSLRGFFNCRFPAFGFLQGCPHPGFGCVGSRGLLQKRNMFASELKQIMYRLRFIAHMTPHFQALRPSVPPLV